jgi:TRAP-type transport system small permease protein
VKRTMKRIASVVDSAFEYLGLGLLAAMVLIVTWQVFARQGLGSAPQWSEEVSLILMVWVGFIGIAIGFRERVHIALEFVVSRLPQALQKVIEKLNCVLVLVFGLFLVLQGWEFTTRTMSSTLASTGLPRATLYVILPISGFMICVYSVLQLFGVSTEKHTLEAEDQEGEVTPKARL